MVLRLLCGLALCLAVSGADNEPMPVSLGELMAKIEAGAPKEDILHLIQAVTERVKEENTSATLEYETNQVKICDRSTYRDYIQSNTSYADQQNKTINDLRAKNEDITTNRKVQKEKEIAEASAKVNATESAMATTAEKIVNMTEDFTKKQTELQSALDVVAEVRQLIQGTMDDMQNLQALITHESHAKEKTADSVKSLLQSKLDGSAGFKKHLLETSLKILNRDYPGETEEQRLERGRSIDTIMSLLAEMRNDFRQSLQSATEVYHDEMNTALEQQVAYAEELTNLQGGINNSKIEIAKMAQEFAQNDIDAAAASDQRTTAIGNAMTNTIREADRSARCALMDQTFQDGVTRRNAELQSLSDLNSTIWNMDFSSTLNHINATTDIQEECYCDSLCSEKNDCCAHCQPEE